MAKRKRRSLDSEPGLPPKPEPTEPVPGPGIPPQPQPSPGEPPSPRPGEPIPRQDPGLMDPRHFSPAPGDPSPGVGTPLQVEPLPGPTEASADVPPPEEPAGEGLV